MDLNGKTVVVTGAASGIGKGLAEGFADQGARIVCADIDVQGAQDLARHLGGHAFECDVSRESDIQALIAHVEDQIAPIDLFCANAGILTLGGPETSDEDWDRTWKTNVMSQVWTARHLVPRMLTRGHGYILITASAAGLLNQPGAAPYGVTKHASVGFAEWLALTYGHRGIKVSVLCPQAVRSEMMKGHEFSVASLDGILEPKDVAETCVQALRKEQFLILPHAHVQDYIRSKSEDYDRWIAGMNMLHQRFSDAD